MAVVQAFASNVFNICMALGLLWLLQALAGACDYGGGDADSSCAGCFLPSGVAHIPCPGALSSADAEMSAGSLTGTVLFTVCCVMLVVATLACNAGRIPSVPAAAFLGLYATYAFYQVAAQRQWVAPLCVAGVCI